MNYKKEEEPHEGPREEGLEVEDRQTLDGESVDDATMLCSENGQFQVVFRATNKGRSTVKVPV